MRNESFYTTAAQVLPTLLIALALEGTAIFRRYVDLLATQELIVRVPHAEIALGPPPMATGVVSDALRREPAFRPLVTAFFGTIALFVAGELCALLVVFVGTGGWLVWLAGPLTGLALVVMVLAVVAFPLIRVLTETIFQMDEQVPVTAVDDETGEVYGWLTTRTGPGEQTLRWGLRPNDKNTDG